MFSGNTDVAVLDLGLAGLTRGENGWETGCRYCCSIARAERSLGVLSVQDSSSSTKN